MITLRGPVAAPFSRLTSHLSGDPVASTRCQTAVEIALSIRAGRALLDWIAVNRHLCADCALDDSTPVNNSRLNIVVGFRRICVCTH